MFASLKCVERETGVPTDQFGTKIYIPFGRKFYWKQQQSNESQKKAVCNNVLRNIKIQYEKQLDGKEN